MLPPKEKGWTSQAFSLVELLVTVVIIAILASLLIPGLQRARYTALRVKDLGNLRQVGTALLNFTGDNNGRLPGPTPTGQQATYYGAQANAATAFLAYYLAPYLNCPTDSNNSYVVRTCPPLINAGVRAVQPVDTATKINYLVNYGTSEIPPDAKGVRTLFGNTYYNPPVYPWSLQSLTAQSLELSKLWALCDLDQKCTSPTVKASGWFPTLPAKPVHGNTRNFLYLDGHVESLADTIQP